MKRAKPHLSRQCDRAGWFWRCELPSGSHGDGDTPEAAMASAKNAEAWRRLLERAVEGDRPCRRPMLMFGKPRVWLATDQDAPRANERIVC